MLSHVAHATASLRVTESWLASELQRRTSGFDHQTYLDGIGYRESDQGLLVSKAFLIRNVRQGQWFGSVLHARSGLQLILINSADNFKAPVFSGLIVDKRGQVVANAKLRYNNAPLGVLYTDTAEAVDKVKRYSQSAAWVRMRFKDTKEAEGFGREAEVGPALTVTGEESIRNVHALNKRARILMSLYGVGTNRPTWTLVFANAAGEFNDERMAAMLRLSKHAPRQVVFVAYDGQLMMFKDGVLRSGPCAPALSTVGAE